MKDFKTNVKLARKGDTAAFAELYSEVYRDLYHCALYNLRNEHDACDVVSEAVLDAFSSIKNLKNEEAFKAWIMRILFVKIKKRQKEYINCGIDIDEAGELFSDFEYDSIELKNAIDSLDSSSKAILSLSALGGYTSAEIGRICKMNSSSVRSRLSRIREKIGKGVNL